MQDDLTKDIFLRPRFKIERTETDEQLLLKFKSNLNDGNCKYCNKIVDNHIFVDIPVKENHFWSPQLHLEIVKESEELTMIKGLFGPKPQVWTLFMFLHLVVGALFLIFSIIWYVRWTLEANTLLPMFITLALPIIWFGLYFYGRWGRRKGKPQIEELQQFLMKTLEKKISN